MKSWIWRGLAALACTAAVGAAQAAEPCASQPGGAVEAARRANAFVQTLSADQKQTVLRPRDRASIIKWSNLPLALAPRIGLRLGDLRPDQAAAAQQLLRAVLSSCGVDLLAEIRAADGVLMPLDTRKIGWNPGNYFMAFIGAPSPSQPWSLQVGGHHMAYNLAFNAPQVSATPLFDGVEPTQFVADGRAHEPLAVQMGAMRAVASSIADLPGARLAGEFRDVTRGATENGDTNFPMTYPAGDSGRGVAYAKLAAAQKALVR